MDTDERLDGDELAAHAGTSREHIAELVDAGILRRAEDGRFRAGDVQRVLVADALVEAGLSVDLLARGIDAGVVSFEDTDLIYAHPGRASLRVAELATELGLGDETLLRIITAFGMPRPEPESMLHEPDVERLRAFVEAWRPLGDGEVMVRAARLYGDALRRAAEAWMGIFEDAVLTPMASRAVPWSEMRVRAMEPGMRLLAVGRSMLPWLLDQHLFQALNQLNLESIERQLAVLGITPSAPRQPSAVLFSDLAGYTRMTEERGDEAAAESATRLAVVAEEVAGRHAGRLVKLLGDGVMMHFPDAADALAAAVELHAAMDGAGLPPAHSGIHAGRVIRREADLFGRTVNLAARLAAAAGADEILVTREVLDAARASGAKLPPMAPLPPLELKGISSPVSPFRVTR